MSFDVSDEETILIDEADLEARLLIDDSDLDIPEEIEVAPWEKDGSLTHNVLLTTWKRCRSSDCPIYHKGQETLPIRIIRVGSDPLREALEIVCPEQINLWTSDKG